ncbi:MAG: hypothetical protein LBI57_07030 [Helicobacteraceae bacterium]|nr:hypothetical protein [Helicobacteraceae bacterium]
MKVYLPTAIAAESLGVSERAIQLAIKRGSRRYPYREVSGRGGNSGKSYEPLAELTPNQYRALCAKHGREFDLAPGKNQTNQ